MALISLERQTSLLLLIDLQESLLPSIWESERVIRRSQYLLEVSRRLDIPVLVTTQNAAKLGAVHATVNLTSQSILDKLSFSAWKDPAIREWIVATGRRQIVICGVETHICIGLTANDLVADQFEVVVCPDAVSSSNQERHKLGMERMRDAGVLPVHSEAVAYEWVGRSDDLAFKEVLTLTKDLR